MFQVHGVWPIYKNEAGRGFTSRSLLVCVNRPIHDKEMNEPIPILLEMDTTGYFEELKLADNFFGFMFQNIEPDANEIEAYINSIPTV